MLLEFLMNFAKVYLFFKVGEIVFKKLFLGSFLKSKKKRKGEDLTFTLVFSKYKDYILSSLNTKIENLAEQHKETELVKKQALDTQEKSKVIKINNFKNSKIN